MQSFHRPLNYAANLLIIAGSVAISGYAYSLAPQMAAFRPLPRMAIACVLGVGVKILRAYPYYLSCCPQPPPAAWRWLVVGLVLEGADLATLIHLFRVTVAIDSALGAIAVLWGWSGSWAISAFLADLGFHPVRLSPRRRWFAPQLRTLSNRTPHTVEPNSAHFDPVTNSSPESTVLAMTPILNRSPVDGVGNNDIMPALTDRIRNRIILGLPGSGKGFLLSHLLRQVKAKDPDLRLFLIDPKGDERELGYFEGAVDVLHRAQTRTWSDRQKIEFVRDGLDRFNSLAATGERVLLTIDECTLLGGAFKLAGNKDLQSFISSLATTGDSQGLNVWLVAQAPNLDELGISTGVASQLLKLIIARKDDLDAIEMWSNLALMRGIKLDEALAPIRQSEIGRAIYWGGDRAWHPLPKLPNYSGFDRDTRTVTPIERGDIAPLTEIQTSILEYFARATPNPKNLNDLKKASRIVRLSVADADLIDALGGLIERGYLVSPMPGFWVLTNHGISHD